MKFSIFPLVLILLCTASPAWSKAQGEFPPSISELTIPSGESRMPGIIYQAAGSGPHPTVVLLHGYPGNEKNLDVAQALRRMGWNVAFFHYRGAWGSEGEFSYRGAEQDVQTVVTYLQAAENATKLRVDPARISLVGHSMGGHMAMAGLLDNPEIRCGVSYDGANMAANGKGLGDSKASAKMWRDYGDSLFMLNGWSGAKSEQEIADHGKELDLVGRAEKLAGRPVLLISANTQVVPEDVHIKPLVEAFNAGENNSAQYILIEDDHSFSASRFELIEATAKFLNKSCR